MNSLVSRGFVIYPSQPASSIFISSSFIQAGAVAYIATPEIQSTCFWKQAPYGTATDQAIEFWENLYSGNVPIGKALRDAKWKAYNTWQLLYTV